MNLFETDKELAKRVTKELICQEHHEKVKLTFDYDRDENAIPYVSKCCCYYFAKVVANALYETGVFDVVYLENKTGLTATDIIIEK